MDVGNEGRSSNPLMSGAHVKGRAIKLRYMNLKKRSGFIKEI
jgi:hypothetical protein